MPKIQMLRQWVGLISLSVSNGQNQKKLGFLVLDINSLSTYLSYFYQVIVI
jgi:hypothetical protein